MNRGIIGLCGAALAMMSQPAFAQTQVFTITEGGPAAGLGSGPFGTVTVTQSAGTLQFTQTLAPGYRIHDGNFNHNAFAFSIVGDPAITVSGLTAGFTAIDLSSGSSTAEPPFGSYRTAIDCTVCGPGYAGGYAGTLSFTVSASSALTLASLDFNTVGGKNVYFTTDVIDANGTTGNVGATLTPGSAVPEPATWAMMIVGFGAVGGAMRRRRTVTVRFA